MTPIHIIKKIAQESEVIDIEMVGARLEYHNIKISVYNTFLADTGNSWGCSLLYTGDFDSREEQFHAPSLRSAILKALTKASEDRQERMKKERKEKQK
jgi:hypothetical protein